MSNKDDDLDRHIAARSSADRPSLLRPARLAAYAGLKDQTRALLKTLTPLEERVLMMRFSFGLTLEEIAGRSNVSLHRIRQIESKALRRLRHPSRAPNLNPSLDESGEIVEADLPSLGEESTKGSSFLIPSASYSRITRCNQDRSSIA